MKCQGCSDGDCHLCGMQTWCTCDCEGYEGSFMPGPISDSYEGPADPCPDCNPNGVPSGHAKPSCGRCAGTFWLPDECFVCKGPADGYYQGRPEFPTCGGRKCEMKMKGGIDAHEHGTNR